MFRRKEESFDFDPAEESAARQTSSSSSATESSASNASATASESRGSSSNAPAAAQPSWAPAAPAFRSAASASSASSAAPAARPVPSAKSSSSPLSSAQTSSASKGGKRILTVGNDILLKGEIATCDRLVIEGEVDAKLKDVHTVEIAENGSFRGSAEIQDAEISGLFEGNLVVRGRLIVYSTGKVRGKISYGEVEIERGGQLTGEISIFGQAEQKPAGKKEAA